MKKKFSLGLLFFLSLFLVVNAQNKAAFLSTFNSLSDLQTNGDDDEIAAAEWFINVYGGDFLSASAVPETDLNQYNVIWLAIERVNGFSNFPSELINSSVLDNVMDYYIAGGNLLLTGYAVKYLSDLGRANNMFGELWEDGSNVPDDNDVAYGTIPVFGRFFTNGDNEFSNGAIDHSDDPVFAGLISEDRTTNEGINAPCTYTFYPLIGPGQKEVHRIVWTADCPSNANGVIPGGIDNPAFLTSFETEYNMQALATLEYTLGYFRVAIGRWLPHNFFKGKAITISDSGYEWNQNSGTNLYQSNIERLTKNALDELGGTLTSIRTPQIRESYLKFIDHRLFVCIENFVKARIITVDGQLIDGFDTAEYDVSGLAKGVYLILMENSDGKLFTTRFVK